MPFATKEVVITPYDPRWPQQFEMPAAKHCPPCWTDCPSYPSQHVGSHIGGRPCGQSLFWTLMS